MTKASSRWIAAAALVGAAVLIGVPGKAGSLPAADPAPRQASLPASLQTPLPAPHGVVSSAHPLATEAGIAILQKGGNAFDAAVAVATTLNVTEPAMSGMGGYGTILVYDARKDEIRFLNSSGLIPAGLDPDVFRPPHPRYRENRRGPAAVSTPGNVHAWEAMSKEYGALPWNKLFEAAVDLAENGFPLGEGGAATIKAAFDEFPAHVRAFYGRDGHPLGAGDRLVQKDLARSLQLVAQEGARAFYSGPIAQAIDAAMSSRGGFLALADLESDEAEWREPIGIPYRDCEVFTASPPATAFPSLIRLGLMSRFDAAALGHNSAAFLHRFIEATKHAFWCRLRYAGDPEVAPPPLATLLSAAYWDEQAAAIDLERAKPFVYPGLGESDNTLAAQSHTTHFVVADAAGNIVTATQTLGNAFGSRIMPEGTGIWLNNSLAYCTFEPKGNPMDAHPGRRKLSGDCPTIIVRGGRPWAALGTPGGHTIGQTVPQMVMNLVDFGMDVREAVAAPRVSFVEPDTVAYEAGIAKEVLSELEAQGHKLRIARALGNAHALTIEYGPDGKPVRFRGASDPRGSGRAKEF
ncbi:MAG: gamma-glutamyltransferase [Candidatus Aminicenantes bacterium]|nr:gamma-glutamyltransferase [Candidatus Aminicenantes bacterium]